MFRNLVESGSHRQDLQRKGRFFFGTLAAYALFLTCAGVASVFAYDAHLENQNLELVTLFTPALPETPVEMQRETLRPTTSDNTSQTNIRTAVYKDITNTTEPPKLVSTTPNTVPPVPPYEQFKLGEINSVAAMPAAPNGDNPRESDSSSSNGNSKRLPPPPQPSAAQRNTQTPPAQQTVRRMSGHVLEGKATFKPAPAYPEAAKIVGISGAVAVQILVDETGRVISAQAASGHSLLRQAAVQAALRARFTPTLLSNQPVKVSGMITYNFVLQ
ncbi:MAG: energy transducer TonB [Pyrinomonadaceae bacterium]|nr:energy transducer TonB [Pyrinomonadaceae bacterium]